MREHASIPIRISRERCVDYAQSSHLEWLETNGTGGFAMGTVSGANTRRYHGLLVASVRPPVERFVLLAKLDETVFVDGVEVSLGTNQYPGALYPTGFRNLLEFRLDPFPIWTFDIGGASLEKKVFLIQGEQTVVIQYQATRACDIRAHPFLAFRDYHSLGKANASFNATVAESHAAGIRALSIRPYSGMPELYLRHSDGGRPFEANGDWHYNTEYLEELDRGLDFRCSHDLARLDEAHAPFPASPARDLAASATARLAISTHGLPPLRNAFRSFSREHGSAGALLR